MRPAVLRHPASILATCRGVVVAALVVSGCAVVSQRATDEAAPKTVLGGTLRTAPRTLPIELLFVRHDEADTALADELWHYVDEQSLDPSLRRTLNANGLRAGVVTGQLPAHLAARFEAAPLADEPALPADLPLTRRFLRLLPDRRSEVVAAAAVDQLVLLEERDGGVTGSTFHDASGVFGLRVRPAADGRVVVELTPEIRHGPVERTWTGEEGMLRLEAGQRRHTRDDLRLSVDLPLEGMLVVAGGGAGGGTLGDTLLRDATSTPPARRVLAIRPTGRVVDPAFAPEEESAAVSRRDEGITVR